MPERLFFGGLLLMVLAVFTYWWLPAGVTGILILFGLLCAAVGMFRAPAS